MLGAGDDTFVWNPGDGSDIIEGQDGSDTMLFNGANINEKIDISANGGRVRFTRDVAAITMDLGGVENIQFNALGGADAITVNDLTGTGAQRVNLDLGANDGAADTVVIDATGASDVITVTEDDREAFREHLASWKRGALRPPDWPVRRRCPSGTATPTCTASTPSCSPAASRTATTCAAGPSPGSPT